MYLPVVTYLRIVFLLADARRRARAARRRASDAREPSPHSARIRPKSSPNPPESPPDKPKTSENRKNYLELQNILKNSKEFLRILRKS